MLRHVVATTLRYSFYQLGMPIPEAAPVRILRLRLFLDAIPMRDLLGGQAGGDEFLAALLCPGGAGAVGAGARRLTTAMTMHRMRLRFLGPKRHPQREEERAGSDRTALWTHFRERLKRRLPHLCDLVLWELCETLHRRQRREQGVSVGPSLGREAWRWRRGEHSVLSSFGPPDPLAPCWTDETVRPRSVPSVDEIGPMPDLPSGRGVFREGYRRFLSELRPTLSEIGWLAKEEGQIDDPDDVFFLPFDLGEELTKGVFPDWLKASLATNRREFEGLELEGEHAAEIDGSPAMAPIEDRSSLWASAPVRSVD
ncbi:MAG: hypothetical protein VYE73_02425 [Acidobacteriota bacterium]|nr:hypothetical protein [Acidobacteriota bacterium]